MNDGGRWRPGKNDFSLKPAGAAHGIICSKSGLPAKKAQSFFLLVYGFYVMSIRVQHESAEIILMVLGIKLWLSEVPAACINRRFIELLHNGTAFRLERDVIWWHFERALRDHEFDLSAAKRDGFCLGGVANKFRADFITKWSECPLIKGFAYLQIADVDQDMVNHSLNFNIFSPSYLTRERHPPELDIGTALEVGVFIFSVWVGTWKMLIIFRFP